MLFLFQTISLVKILMYDIEYMGICEKGAAARG